MKIKEQFLEEIMPYLRQLAEAEYDFITNPERSRKRMSWYASDIGSCMRGLYYDRLGELQPIEVAQFVKNIGHEGKMKELEILIQYIIKGTKILDTQIRLYDEKLDVSGRPDVILVEDNQTIVEEIKTVSSRAFWYNVIKDDIGNVVRFNPYPHHVLQLTFYLKQLQETYPNIKGRLKYRSRDDGTVFNVDIPYEEQKWQEIKEFFTVLNHHWNQKSLPETPRTIIQDTKTRKWGINFVADYCQYHHYCLDDIDWKKKALKEVYQLNKK